MFFLVMKWSFLTFYLTATNNKEFTGKVLCRKESSEKQLGSLTKHHISQTGKCCEREDRSE